MFDDKFITSKEFIKQLKFKNMFFFKKNLTILQKHNKGNFMRKVKIFI